jgi:hypothetical protein
VLAWVGRNRGLKGSGGRSRLLSRGQRRRCHALVTGWRQPTRWTRMSNDLSIVGAGGFACHSPRGSWGLRISMAFAQDVGGVKRTITAATVVGLAKVHYLHEFRRFLANGQ